MSKYICDVENREGKELLPGIKFKIFWQEQLMLSLAEFEPDAIVERHSHPHEQAGIILEGEATFIIGDETHVLTPGMMYIIPGGVEHKVIAHGENFRAVDIFSPVRDEYKY